MEITLINLALYTMAVLVIGGLVGALTAARNEQIKFDKFRTDMLNARLAAETIKVEYFVVAIEMSDRSINEITHRKATEDRLIRDLAKELSERSVVRFRCNWYQDQNIVKVEAHLRALPADLKQDGKSYIYKPLHSEVI